MSKEEPFKWPEKCIDPNKLLANVGSISSRCQKGRLSALGFLVRLDET